MTLKTSQDFPGGPVVKILHFHCRGHAESILIKPLLTNKQKHAFAWSVNGYFNKCKR